MAYEDLLIDLSVNMLKYEKYFNRARLIFSNSKKYSISKNDLD